jgi:hypothetical protein
VLGIDELKVLDNLHPERLVQEGTQRVRHLIERKPNEALGAHGIRPLTNT